MPQHSTMSITQLCNAPDADERRHSHTSCTSTVSSSSHTSGSNEIIHDDPDVQLAAEALGDMARAQPPITLPPLTSHHSAPSTSPSSPLPTPSSSSISNQRFSFSSDSTVDDDYTKPHPHRQAQSPQHFMHRVSNIPLVHSALRVYENSKASSTVVKYGAEMVESFAAPIYDKFGRRALSGAVEDWGCKQLDKLEERYPTYVTPREEDAAMAAARALARASLNDNYELDTLRRRRKEDDATGKKQSRSRQSSRSTSPHRPYSLSAKSHGTRRRPQSRWQHLMVHAGSAAGTTAAVISEESMKCLRYCLSWLQYAAQHIDQQMNILRSFLVSLASGSTSSSTEENGTTAVAASSSSISPTLAAVKKEIIDTLRKVVDVVSKYAGSGLPEQAKRSVRGFILALPGRWAVLNTSTTASPAGSPALGPHTPTHVQETSIKLLNFGGESIEMLQSVSAVFSDTIDRAELWLDRLRVVGVAGSPSRGSNEEQEDPVPMEPMDDQMNEPSSPERMDTAH